MITTIKKILFRLLGIHRYLKILHLGFCAAYKSGFLKRNYIYKYHYFVKHLIHKGDVVVDIGANLGYFSVIFADLVKEDGKLIAIEPVKPFFDTLTWALQHYKNCTCYNYALGLEHKPISLSVPKHYGYIRTGLACVNEHFNRQDDYVFRATMIKGSDLLKNEPRIDYIKCDVEGYETYVLSDLKQILQKHLPVLQIEIAQVNKKVITEMMFELNYQMYSVYKNKLVSNRADMIEETGDYLFIPKVEQSKSVGKLRNNKYLAG